MDRRSIFAFLAAALVAAPAVDRPALAGEKKHRLAIHVDQSDIAQMNLALGNASNVFEHYKSRGEEVDIEIVTYSQGLHMLREDVAREDAKRRVFCLRQHQAPDGKGGRAQHHVHHGGHNGPLRRRAADGVARAGLELCSAVIVGGLHPS